MYSKQRVSFFSLLKLPDTVNVLLIFAFILLISPYLSGSDFGIFKIPSFSANLLQLLRIAGPIIFVVTLILFLPLWRKPLDKESMLQLDDFISLPIADKDKRRHFLFEVAVRNPSDHLITITKVVFEFDQPAEQKRAASNLSTTYKVVVKSDDFCFLEGPNGIYPVKSSYNKLNWPELDILVHCAQELGAESADRFRFRVDINDDFDLKGPMKTVSIVILYNISDTSNLIRGKISLDHAEITPFE